MHVTSAQPRHRLRAFVTVSAVGALTLGLLAVAAPPASAQSTISLTGVQANSQTGIPQNLIVTAVIDGAPCGSVLAPAATIVGTLGTAPLQTIGTATYSQCLGSNTYQYTFQWVPQVSGTYYVAASLPSDGTTSNFIRSQINPVPTTTRITLANTVRVGVPTPVTASVTANNGSLASPQGTIQFAVVGGGNIGGPIPLNNAVPSTVQIQWTPAVLGQFQLTATYTPGPVQGVISTTCGNSCTSAPDSVQVTGTGVNVYLANPPQFAVGVPSTITAVVSVVPPSGTATFTVNGAAIASVPVQANGQAQITWTPPAVGQFTIGVNWVGNGGVTGSARDVITVVAAPAQADRISVAPAGQGAWSPAGVYTLGNGTVINFVTSTASGAPVTLTAPGSCTMSGNQLRVTQGNGTCRLVASSPGGNGFGPNTVSFNINLVPGVQTTRAQPRASGRINRGSTVTLLNNRNNITNAGARPTWRITSGGANCRLVFPANGNIRLRGVRNGNCNVRATAPAVAGQWQRMVINRTYRVR